MIRHAHWPALRIYETFLYTKKQDIFFSYNPGSERKTVKEIVDYMRVINCVQSKR